MDRRGAIDVPVGGAGGGVDDERDVHPAGAGQRLEVRGRGRQDQIERVRAAGDDVAEVEASAADAVGEQAVAGARAATEVVERGADRRAFLGPERERDAAGHRLRRRRPTGVHPTVGVGRGAAARQCAAEHAGLVGRRRVVGERAVGWERAGAVGVVDDLVRAGTVELVEQEVLGGERRRQRREGEEQGAHVGSLVGWAKVPPSAMRA